MNFLNKPAPDMLGDIQVQHTAALDREAKRMGFPSYEAMKAWEAQRQKPTGGTVTGKRQAPASLDTAMSWHPKVIFEKIAGILDGINSR